MLLLTDLQPTDRPVPNKARSLLFVTFKNPEGLSAYVERLRKNESFSDLFARQETMRRDRRARMADAALCELRRSARLLQREILWRKLLRTLHTMASHLPGRTFDRP